MAHSKQGNCVPAAGTLRVLERLDSMARWIWSSIVLATAVVGTACMSAEAEQYAVSSSLAEADASVYQAAPDGNYGSAQYVYLVGSSSYDDGGSGYAVCALWQWSLPHPSGHSVQSVGGATVRLWTHGIPQGRTFRFRCFGISSVHWRVCV